MYTRCIVKTSGLTRGVCVKIGDFIKFKGSLLEIIENKRSSENQKPPRKNRPEKWIFLSLAFYNAPSLHTVEQRPLNSGSFFQPPTPKSGDFTF